MQKDNNRGYKFLTYYGCAGLAFSLFCIVHTHEYNEELKAENRLLREAYEKQIQQQQLHKAHRPPVLDSDEPTGNAIAIRNKNPLNIKCLGKRDKWLGQVGTDKFGHAVFEDWEYGIREASLTLRSYARKHGIDTVEGVVKRFAEGNQKAYIRYLSSKLGVAPDQQIDLIAYMPQLLRHMARFESGQPIPDRWFAPYDVLAKL